MITGKHYAKEDLIKEGYNLEVDLSAPSPCSNQKIRTLILNNKSNKRKFQEVDRLENVAIKLNGSDYFIKSKSISHRRNNKGKNAFMYTLRFYDGQEEPIYLSDISEMLVKDVESEIVKKILNDF